MTRFFSPRMLRKIQGNKEDKQKSCRCLSDHIHDSRLEAKHCNTLLYMKKAKEIKDYERQKTFHLDVLGSHVCDHRVDFVLEHWDGHKEVHECKGFENTVWPIKKRLFEILFPEIPYTVIR